MASSGSLNTNKYSTSSSGTIGLNLTWYITSQSIEDNTTTIRWELKSNGTMSRNMAVTGGPITVEIGGITVLNQTGRFRVYGGGRYYQASSVVIQHEDDGTKSIDISVRAALYNSQVNCTASASNVALDPIPRCAYITSVNNFTDESNPIMNYANPLGDVITSTQACISLTDSGTNPEIAYRDIEINGSSYTFNLTDSERNILRAACPNSNTLDVYFIIKSIMNGDTYYSKKLVTMSVVNVNPTITNAQYYDTNADTIAVTQDATKIVQALSTVEFKFGTLTALKYATLVSVSITINGTTVTESLSGTTVTNRTKAIGTLNVTSDLVATVDLVDSRGNHTTQNITLSIYGWSVPTGAVNLARINNFETDCTLKVQASWSSIDGQNAVTIKYQIKKTSESTYGAEVTINNNTTYVVQMDNAYEWDVRVKITDSIGGTSTYNLTVGKGIPIIFFDRLHRSMSLNCFPTHDDCIEVNKVVTTGSYVAQLPAGTTMSSGSKTFTDDGYSGVMIIGRVTNTGSHHSRLIPKVTLSSTDMRYCITDENNYITFDLKVENGDITVTFGTKSSTGYIEQIYGVY